MQKKKKHYHFSFEKSKKVDAVQFVSIELIELIVLFIVSSKNPSLHSIVATSNFFRLNIPLSDLNL